MNKKIGSLPKTPASWEPPDSLVAPLLALLKSNYADLWDEIKSLELSNGTLANRAGEELTSIIMNANSELDGVMLAKTRHHIRKLARKEAGLKI